MKSHRMLHKTLLALMLGMALNGCGKQETPAATIASVNGVAISSEQLNMALSRMNLAQQNVTPQAKNRVVQALVDQQLLVQKATEQKLDKDPAVKLLLEAARNQVLSQVYLQRAGQAVAKPTENDIAGYYNQHPELFSQRRLYNLQELTIAAPPDRISEIKSRLETSPGLGEFVSWLRTQDMPFRTGSGVKSAEQLPMEIAARMQTMQDGQLIALPSADGVTVLQVVSTQSAPIALDKAHTAIERYLIAAKQHEAATADIQKLRNEAKIEYLGEFASLTKPTQDKPDSSTAGLPPIK